MLRELRIGRCSDITLANLMSRSNLTLPEGDPILPTNLYCTNRDVDYENNQRLKELPGESVLFKANDKFNNCNQDWQRDNQLKQIANKVADDLNLKVGAQVMHLRNAPDYGIMNGSRGVVTGFATFTNDWGLTENSPVVLYDNGVEVAHVREQFYAGVDDGPNIKRKQFPLKLAWALSKY